MNNQNSRQRVMRMERHIFSPREVRRGCDEREARGGLMKWLRLALVHCGEEKEDRG